MTESMFADMLSVSAITGLTALPVILRRSRMGSRMASGWACICWFVLSMRLLLPFRFSEAVVNIKLPSEDNTASEIIPNMTDITADFAVDTNAIQTVTHINWLRYAAVLWLIGAVIFSVWHLAVYIITKRGINKQSRPADDSIQKKAQEIALQMGIKRNFRVLVCCERIAPMLMGVIRPVIYLPDKMTEKQLDIALRHELIHLRRNDILYKLLLTAANAVHWFNPLIWLMAKTADRDAEAACDEAVLADSDVSERKAYCSAILDMMSIRRIPFATALSYKKEDIMKRFRNIMDTSKRKSGAVLLAVLLSISLLFSGFAGCTTEGESSTETEEPKTTTAPTTTTTTQTTTTTETATTTTTAPTEDTSTWVIYEGSSYMDAGRAMELINDYRVRNGLPALWTGSENLSIVAQDRIMEAITQFSHTRPNGERFTSAFAENGVSYTVACENLARGQLTAEQVVNEWMASPNHQGNMLNPSALYGCVACAKGYYDGMEYVYWIFMAYAP